MAADPRAFNGSTLTFNGAPIARLIGIQYRENGRVIDVTEPADLTEIAEIGPPGLEVIATVKRMPTVSTQDTGTLAVTFHDGSTLTLSGTWAVSSVSGGGQWGGAISGEITFVPTTAQS